MPVNSVLKMNRLPAWGGIFSSCCAHALVCRGHKFAIC